MKYVSEFRDESLARVLAESICKEVTRPWTIMEVCGGQTHAIVKYGLHALLPESLRIIHGPGCPVCVTPIEVIDSAQQIAQKPGVIFASFGDMLRVPGSNCDLLTVKARGADIRIVYSPLDALQIAQKEPDKQVVFFGVGFETTAPTTASTILLASEMKLANFSVLVSHVRVPPAMELLLSAPDNELNGFLLAGHVCTVMGYREYLDISARYHIAQVVTGFEPIDILEGILLCVKQLESGKAVVENQYSRLVQEQGNLRAIDTIEKVYEICDLGWRGIGMVSRGGLRIRDKYSSFDATIRFETVPSASSDSTKCQSGLVLRGKIRPDQCPAFASQCNPEHPLGAPMVSAEGACAAYYQFSRNDN